MKIKILIFAILVYFKGSSQEKLNALITVDDVITGSFNVYDSYLIIQHDTIDLKYEMGRFELGNNNNFLKKIDNSTNVNLCFKYYSTCPKQMHYSYNIELKLSLLLQNYLLLKIYNFNNYPNIFSKNDGYGKEFISPLGGEALPRKKKKYRIKNSCN